MSHLFYCNVIWALFGASVIFSILALRKSFSFFGPETGFVVMAILAALTTSYGILAIVINGLNRSKIRGMKAVSILCVLLPLVLSIVFLIRGFSKNSEEYRFLLDVFNLPLPETVKNVRRYDIELYPKVDVRFYPQTILFDISEKDVDSLIQKAGLVRVSANEINDRWNGLCDTSQIPGDESWETYHARGNREHDYFVRVCPERRTVAVIIKIY